MTQWLFTTSSRRKDNLIDKNKETNYTKFVLATTATHRMSSI